MPPPTPPLQDDLTIKNTLAPGDLVTITVHPPLNHTFYLEITKVRPAANTFDAVCQGQLLRLQYHRSSGGDSTNNNSRVLQITKIEHTGYWPRLSDAWVKKHPALLAALKKVQKERPPPHQPYYVLSQALERQGTLSLQCSDTSLEAFTRLVTSSPSYWCDGTGPNDPPEPSAEQTTFLSAGELCAFVHGYRGIVLVQLDLPAFDGSSGTGQGARIPFPLLRPFVLRFLHQALDSGANYGAAVSKQIVAVPSSAARGAAQSLVLSAKHPPFRAWAKHAAEIGVQASLVADSPYYKLLVGRMLGYKVENIMHHIEVCFRVSLALLLFVALLI